MKRYTRSNLKFTMDSGKVNRISEADLYVLYRLYSKAFDCVDHPTLWNMMEEMCIPEHMVEVISTSWCVYSLTRVDLDCDYLHTPCNWLYHNEE